MRLLLDEMLSPLIAQGMRRRGHDVEAVERRPPPAALSDREVIEAARAQGRAVVTNNVVDFRPLHHEAIVPGGPGHFGMVFIPGAYRRTKADIGRIVDALEAKLAQFPGDGDLANGEAWLAVAESSAVWA